MSKHIASLLCIAFLITAFTFPATVKAADMAVYNDSLQNGWSDWSWATVDFSSTGKIHTGSNAISVTGSEWSALYLHVDPLNGPSYTNLDFWINGGSSGGQQLEVSATRGGVAQTIYNLNTLSANTWTHVTIPLSTLGVSTATDFDGFWIQDTSGSSYSSFYVDDITLLANNTPPPATVINIDTTSNRHAISPLIYGVAYGTTAQLQDLNAPLNRLGGNDTSMYNYQQNASNKGFDWYFESIGEDSATSGERIRTFISDTKNAGAEPSVTIPMIGWVAKLGAGRSKLASFSIAKYGAQTANDYNWMPDAGNGISAAGGNPYITNDPNDANIPADVNFQGGLIDQIISNWGLSNAGGLKYYTLDNEHSIWHSTHRDVHPTGATLDEIATDLVTYASRIKSSDSNAKVVAPEEWGWSGYFYSGYDQQYGGAHNWSSYPDKAAHNNMDAMPYYLQYLNQYEQSHSLAYHLLDYFSLHIYPQGNEFSDDTSEATQYLRNRSTRELWDPNYTSASWISQPVYLIPRMKAWVSTYYPSAKTAITEYNWGAESHINGATTQADILGIFGEQGLDMAARWTVPNTSGPVYKSMQMYRNYDGNKSTFGDIGVGTTATDRDRVAAYSAIRSSDGALTIMVINKVPAENIPVTVNIANFTTGGAAQVYQLTSSNAINHLSDLALSSNVLSYTAPAQSITLFVIPAQTGSTTPTITSLSPSSVAGASTFTLTVNGTNFVSGSIIKFNGTNMTTTYVSPTQLTAAINKYYTTLSSYPGTATVSVLNPDGKRSAGASLTITQPVTPPVISSLSPSTVSGAKTFTLTVNGSNFVSGSIIKWNGTNMTTTYVSATQLTASINKYYTTLTSYPGSATISVLNPDGNRSTNATLTITAPLPSISSLSPASVQGATTFTLTVNGSNFVSGSIIKWNGTNMTTTFVSATQLTASINKYYTTLSSYPGSATVSVLNPDGGRSTGASIAITQPVTPPTITSLSPSSVTGTTTFTLTVNGTGFQSGAVIKWNGTNMTTTFVSSTQLTATIGKYYDTLASYPGSATISVLNPDSGRSTGASLTITSP